MKLFRFMCFYVFTLISLKVSAQAFISNSCDSIILTQEEYIKCLSDTAWNQTLLVTINYITNLKTSLLPKYRAIRSSLIVPKDLQKSIKTLEKIYDSILNIKLSIFEIDMDKNQKYVQPKAYLSSRLALQTFKFYPDIYAILLNDIHLKLSPKITNVTLEKNKKLVEKVISLIPSKLYNELYFITKDFDEGNDKLKSKGFTPLFQGVQNKVELTKYRIVNFLLWTE